MDYVALLKQYYPLLILAGLIIIFFVYAKLKNRKKTEITQPLPPPLQQYPQQQYYQPIQPQPVFDTYEEQPQKEFSLEDNANNVLDYIENFTEQLNKELEKTSKNMEKEVSSIDKVDNKVSKIMTSLKKHRDNLTKQKNVLKQNIGAIENARNALTETRNPICSICSNELRPVPGGYNCPMHGFIPYN